MRGMLLIECACPGVLCVNGFFCGPLEDGGQTFPMGRSEEIYIQFFPFAQSVLPLTCALRVSGGEITRLEPSGHIFALCWPDGLVQLELRPTGAGEPEPKAESAAESTLMRYLQMRLAGDDQSRFLLLRPDIVPEIAPYDAVVPLRFPPLSASDRFDERAGLVRRIAPNIARVDAALATTVPAGMGQKRIERIEVIPSQTILA